LIWGRRKGERGRWRMFVEVRSEGDGEGVLWDLSERHFKMRLKAGPRKPGECGEYTLTCQSDQNHWVRRRMGIMAGAVQDIYLGSMAKFCYPARTPFAWDWLSQIWRT
jgi:hypothetical protein